MESKRKILVRYRRGDGIRAISRELNISRNTVRDIIPITLNKLYCRGDLIV